MAMIRESKKLEIKDLIKEEYLKCATDESYFIRKYCYIQHPVKGRIPFDLYPYQEKIITDMKLHSHVIVLKARQLGFSTVAACHGLWLSLFQNDKNILAIATKQETAKNIITKAKFAYDHLPVWLRNPVVEKNKLNIKFKNGSQIKAISSTSEAGRSEAVSLLLIDEAAFIEKADEIWTAAQATLSTGGAAVILSTPNGVGNFFHRMYQGAELNENGFHPIKLTWRDHPDRDQTWYETQRVKYTDREFNQEFEAEFLGSGNTVIDIDALKYYMEQVQLDPVEKTGFDKNFWIWKYPDLTKQYIVSADVARGDGTDFSAAHVLEAESLEQVAEYRGKIDTEIFGHLLVEMATKYNDALLIIENSTHGWSVVQKAIARNYSNLFYMEEDLKVLDESKSSIKWNKSDKRVPGFTTSIRTRPLIISKFEEFTRNKEIKIYSQRTISEWMTFIWDKGKAQAQDGYNDDLTMALAIGLWVRDTSMKLIYANSERQKAAISAITKTGGEITPIYRPSQFTADPYMMTIGTSRRNLYQGNEQQEDLRWLLG